MAAGVRGEIDEDTQDLEVSGSATLLSESLAAIPVTGPHFQRAVAGRAVVLGVMLLVFISVLLPEHSPGHKLLVMGTAGIEQKFYDAKGAYWQAPGKGISTSEFWGTCKQPNLHTCDSYCCCDDGFYWQSPKSVYQQGKSILEKAAVGTAAKESEDLSATAAEQAAAHAVKDAGKAAVAALVSEEQKCVPRSSVPEEVLHALDDSNAIPGSEVWLACSTFTSNTHTCGEHCCCNGGFKWSRSEEACFSTTARADGDGRDVLEAAMHHLSGTK